MLVADFNTPSESLRQSIESILMQTYEEFEVILVDDGSKISTSQRLADLRDSRIHIIENKRNLGFVGALRVGLAAVTGEYIVRLDPDDFVDKTYIETLVSAIRETPEFSVISCCAQEFNSDGRLGPIIGKAGIKGRHEIAAGDCPIHPASIMRTADIIGVGGYPNYTRAEDLALWCELLLHDMQLRVIPDVLYHYRVDDSDFAKRGISRRGGELKARLHYYPRLGVTPLEYLRIPKSILAGVLPGRLLRWYREHFGFGGKRRCARSNYA